MTEKNIAIIGAGSGGRAFAAYLAKKQFRVNLGVRTPKNHKCIFKKCAIKSEGAINGEFALNLVSTDYKEVVKDCKLILIVTPATAQKEIIKAIAEILEPGQIVLLNPGRTWGAIQAYNIISQINTSNQIYVGETQTLLFTCRKTEDYGVNIIKIKNEVNYCFYPEISNSFVKDYLGSAIPELKPVNDIRITSLNNIGAMVHPATVLLNTGSILRKSPFKFYREGTMNPLADVVEALDKERCQILEMLDVDGMSLLEWFESVYGVKADKIEDAFQTVPSYKNIGAPDKLNMRYLTEDVPTGLVALSSIGHYLDLEMEVCDSLICLADSLLHTNFANHGRTIKNVGVPLKYLHGKSEKYHKVENREIKIIL